MKDQEGVIDWGIEGNKMKLVAYPRIRRLLDSTGDAYLQHGNHFGDSYWGYDLDVGIGCNALGKILMDIRDGNVK